MSIRCPQGASIQNPKSRIQNRLYPPSGMSTGTVVKESMVHLVLVVFGAAGVFSRIALSSCPPRVLTYAKCTLRCWPNTISRSASKIPPAGISYPYDYQTGILGKCQQENGVIITLTRGIPLIKVIITENGAAGALAPALSSSRVAGVFSRLALSSSGPQHPHICHPAKAIWRPGRTCEIIPKGAHSCIVTHWNY